MDDDRGRPLGSGIPGELAGQMLFQFRPTPGPQSEIELNVREDGSLYVDVGSEYGGVLNMEEAKRLAYCILERVNFQWKVRNCRESLVEAESAGYLPGIRGLVAILRIHAQAAADQAQAYGFDVAEVADQANAAADRAAERWNLDDAPH